MSAPNFFARRGNVLTKESIKKLKDTRKKLYDLRDKLETSVIEDIKQYGCTLSVDKNSIILESSDMEAMTNFSADSVVLGGDERAENVISALDAIDVALTFLDAALCDT
jgi:uncharacterized protein with GYD domain